MATYVFGNTQKISDLIEFSLCLCPRKFIFKASNRRVLVILKSRFVTQKMDFLGQTLTEQAFARTGPLLLIAHVE